MRSGGASLRDLGKTTIRILNARGAAPPAIVMVRHIEAAGGRPCYKDTDNGT